MLNAIGRNALLTLLVTSAATLFAESATAPTDEIIHKIETCIPPQVTESPTRFFMKEAPIEIEFTQDDKGEMTGLIVHQQGQEFKADKRP